MPTFHKVGIIIVALGLIALGVDYTLSLRDDLKLANAQVTKLDTTIKLQSALTQSMNEVSMAVIQNKQDLANDENQTKQQIRTIVQTADCSRVLVPESAAHRLRDYAERIRNPTPTD